MQARPAGARARYLFLAVLAALGGWVVMAQAVDPERMSRADEPTTAEPPKPVEEPLYAIDIRSKPWGLVLEWLSDQTKLPVVVEFNLTGTVTIISPKGRKYTLPEIIDLLNEHLILQKHLLIRRERGFVVIPADKKIEPEHLERIPIEDLPKHGNSEVVQIVVPLKGLVAEDFAAEVRKMVGSFGEVLVLTVPNQLILTEKVGNLKRIIKTIKDAESNEEGRAESFSYTCKHIRAREAERILRELLGDPARMQQQEPSRFGDRGGFGFSGGFGDRGGFGFSGGFGERGGPGDRGGPPRGQVQAGGRVRQHFISVDERSNSVLVTGPPDKIAQAKDILKRIDVQGPGGGALAPTLKQYTVPAGTAEVMAKTLQDAYKSPTIKIAAAGTSTVLVWAYPDDQFDIARAILGGQTGGGKTELIGVGNLDAGATATMLKGMFGSDPKTSPYIEADAARNAVVVRGTPDQVQEIKISIDALRDSGGAAGGGNMRVITLDKGSASSLAEALRRMLPELRANPVNVIVPGAEPPRPQPAPEKLPEKPRHDRPGIDGSQEISHTPEAANGGGQIVDPQDKKEPPKKDKPGRADMPVNILAVGNRLVITSEDPQALALVQELVRVITTSTGEGNFVVIRLKNSNAADIARILDETFNGPRQQSGGGSRGPGGGGSGPGGGGFEPGSFFERMRSATQPQQAASQRVDRVRVVADPATNSILVRATPLDMLEIRSLLDNLDGGQAPDSKAVVRTRIIGPLKHATANDVALVIRDVYREQMNENPRSGTVGGFGGFSFGGFGSSSRSFQNRNVDAQGNPRSVNLSVGVDNNTNSLVVACNDALHTDIKTLVDQLEASAKDQRRIIQVISTGSIDPYTVQQTVEAFQGRTSTMPLGGRTSTSPFGTGGFSPFRGGSSFPGGGFSPGGFSPGGFSPGGFSPGGFSPGGGGFSPRPYGGGFGGGGRSSQANPERGPDFFAQRVTDDPEPNFLYDPQQDLNTGNGPSESREGSPVSSGDRASDVPPRAAGAADPVRTAAAEEQQPPKPLAEATVAGPVQVIPLPELGAVIVIGRDKADVDAALKIIEFLARSGAAIEIKIFQLRRADAAPTAILLQQLFLGTSLAGGLTPGLATGGLGQAGALPGELRIAVDERTNSLVVIARRSDMETIELLIQRLEDADVQGRRTEVIQLKNAIAADVATALNTYVANSLGAYADPGQLTAFQAVQRNIVIVPEALTNKLLISATPRYFEEILRVIIELDSEPPQVVIQVLIADVILNGFEEFGVEIGLQSPVLFQRSVVPQSAFIGPGSINFNGPPSVPTGVTVNNTINPAALPGFLFNASPVPPFGNNPVVAPGVVGFQGLGNFGVGRNTAGQNFGGFVFSAASDAFNLLVRALKTQGRMDILARPQVMTMDNQTAQVVVGQFVPYIAGANIGAVANNVIPIINYRDVGVLLTVTPKISPDGKVFMRVRPEISSVAPSRIDFGGGLLATVFNNQFVETTVLAGDGETVAIGGLISKRDTKSENKIPWVGDLPYVGALFRFRQQTLEKRELLVILTPHIVRCRADADRILAEESKRIDWILGDVLKFQGTAGMGPVMQPPPPPIVPDGHPPGPGHVPPYPEFPVAPEVPPQPRPLMPGSPQTAAPPAGPGRIVPVSQQTPAAPVPRPGPRR